MFAGTQSRYYVVLCDGMGTGLGAVQEGKTATDLLRRMLTAGYPADSALQSLNSLCALRSRAGAVTVDLLELQLDTGKGFLYKWGAAPSYLVTKLGAEKIGTAGPPPGITVRDSRVTALRLSLRRGEALIMASDGVDGEGIGTCKLPSGATAGEMAARILEAGGLDAADDATVAVLRLHPLNLST